MIIYEALPYTIYLLQFIDTTTIKIVIYTATAIFVIDTIASIINLVNIKSTLEKIEKLNVEIKEKLANQGCYVIDSVDFWKYYTPINIDHNTNEYYYGLWQNAKLDDYKKMIAIPTGGVIPLHETENDYKYEGDVNVSWSIPVLSGLFSIALQIKPDITFDEFNEIVIENKKIDKDGRTLFDIDKTFSVIKKMKNSFNK